MSEKHYAGFVNIVGRPNVGKSTLMNALVGERMSIITNKPQTTRHRIFGILSGEDFQMIFSDTPGYISNPAYRMQETMNSYVQGTFEDADVMLFITEPYEKYEDDDPFLEKLRAVKDILILVINKIDKFTEEQIENQRKWWEHKISPNQILLISALQKKNTDVLLEKIKAALPEGQPYYPKDQLTDRPERFFVSEIIREKILELFSQEIPYSCEVAVDSFKETQKNDGTPITKIAAYIFVARKTQKPILIGKNGEAIKRLGTAARVALEEWLQQKVHLELQVKIRENWRNDDKLLRYFGYER